MSVLLATWWNMLCESRLTLGNILKLLLAVAGGNFPIFVVMFPKKVEQEKVVH